MIRHGRSNFIERIGKRKKGISTTGTKAINLKYDPDGNRIYKKSGSVERKYIVDIVDNLPTILLEVGPGTDGLFGTADDVIAKTYIYCNGQILAQHDGSYTAPRYFYLHDRLGSVREIINTSGNMVKLYTYEPFGKVIESGDGSPATSNDFMFAGQLYDAEIGQYYLRARQYEPLISRFTSRDPIAGDFQEPLTLHAYLYCLNDPVNQTDPTGRWGKPIHDILIESFFCEIRDNYSSELNAMKAGSAYVDKWKFQGEESAHMHAMRSPDETAEKAEERMQKFIEEQLYYYELYEFLGTFMEDDSFKQTAYFHLGMALHPIMDSTCPSHKGFQAWYGRNSIRSPFHKDPESISEKLTDETVRLMLIWYGR